MNEVANPLKQESVQNGREKRREGREKEEREEKERRKEERRKEGKKRLRKCALS